MRFFFASLTVLVGLVAACSSDDTPVVAGTDAGATCMQQAQVGNRACVPATARSGAALTIAVDQTTGCLPCFTTLKPCAVSVEGSTITLGMRSETCTPPGDPACPAICGIASSKCELPPLAAGEYTIAVEGEPARTTPRTLVVAEDATATSCTLPFPVPTNVDVDLTGISRSCTTDADCVTVTPTACALCACPTAAIATSARARYDAAYRAASSQCTSPSDQVACAPCPAPTPFCNAGGTCAIR